MGVSPDSGMKTTEQVEFLFKFDEIANDTSGTHREVCGRTTGDSAVESSPGSEGGWEWELATSGSGTPSGSSLPDEGGNNYLNLPDDAFLGAAFCELNLNGSALRGNAQFAEPRIQGALPNSLLQSAQSGTVLHDFISQPEPTLFYATSNVRDMAYSNASNITNIHPFAGSFSFNDHFQVQRPPANLGTHAFPMPSSCVPSFVASTSYPPQHSAFHMTPNGIGHHHMYSIFPEEGAYHKMNHRQFYSPQSHNLGDKMHVQQMESDAHVWSSGCVDWGQLNSPVSCMPEKSLESVQSENYVFSRGYDTPAHGIPSRHPLFYSRRPDSRFRGYSFYQGQKKPHKFVDLDIHDSSERREILQQKIATELQLSSPKISRSGHSGNAVVDNRLHQNPISNKGSSKTRISNMQCHFFDEPRFVSPGSHKTTSSNMRCHSLDESIFVFAIGSPSENFVSLDKAAGKKYTMEKDHSSCTFLQDKLKEKPEDLDKIFTEIANDIIGYIMDPHGNLIVQKLLKHGKEEHRFFVLHKLTSDIDELLRISCDTYGAHCVQTLIGTLRTPEKFPIISSSLSPIIVPLMKDNIGHHVVEKCLLHMSLEYTSFVFDAVYDHFLELATHPQGCLSIQRCFDCASREIMHASPENKDASYEMDRLISFILVNARQLSMDAIGNYLVQHVVEKGSQEVIVEMIKHLHGSFVEMSTQKCSSNVVETCIKFATNELKEWVIIELLMDPSICDVMQDPFGNYVIQTALKFSQEPLLSTLLRKVDLYQSRLRKSPYGSKVVECAAGFKR